MQFLYQRDINPHGLMDQALEEFWRQQTTEDAAIQFANGLISGVMDHLPDLDATIVGYAENWRFDRIAVVDRNILRLAIYEMKYRDDIPPVVSMNEAIEIAKKFATEDSGKFVNGILDRVCTELLRPARTSAGS